MALSERTVEDRIEAVLVADGFYRIQVRRARIIEDNGVEVTRQLHRHVLDMDSDLTPESGMARQIADAVWPAAERARWADRPQPERPD